MTLSQITSLVLSLAPYLVPVLAAWLTLAVRAGWVKTPANVRAFIQEVVSTAVTAVEQVSPGQSGAVKKAQAIAFVQDQLSHFGLNVPVSVIDPMIEEAVLLVNLAQGKVAAQAAKAPIAGSN
jgi:hypothetical protein